MSQQPPVPVPPSPLSAEERRQLRRFVHLVEEMLQSRFYRRVPEMDHSLSMSHSPSGEPQFKTPDYDWEDLRSFLLSFRQVAMSDSEPVYITRIRNIISRHAGPQHQDDLRAVKKHLSRILEGKVATATMGMATDSGQVDLTGARLLDTLVNGELFHSGADHEEILQRLRGLPRGSYLWLVLIDVILPVLHTSWYLVKVILWACLLPQEDLPDRLRTAWQAHLDGAASGGE
jgi:hypothetical protein